MSKLATTLVPFFWCFIKQQKKLFITLLLCHLAWAIDNTIMPYIFKIFLHNIIEYTGNKSLIWSVIALPVGLGCALWIITDTMFRCYDFLSARTYPHFEANIRMSIVKYVQGHSYNYFSENFAGSIANKIGDMPQSASNIIRLLIELFIPTLIAFIIGVSIFVTMHPTFGILLTIWVFLHIGICLKCAKHCSDSSIQHSESRSNLTGKIVDSLTNITSVKLSSRSKWELKYLQKFQNNEQKKHQYILNLIFKIRFLQGFLCFLFMGVLSTWLIVSRWQQDIISTSELVYIFYTSWGLTMMAWVSGFELPNFFKEIGICNQALSLIKTKHEITDITNAKTLKVTKGAITFDNVTFYYKKGNNIFKSKNVIIQPGQKVGLVGLSGDGKTTFVNLILRLFDVKSGKITIDGQNIKKVTQDSLHDNISMIPQDTNLFHRSLLENIRYGRINATDEEVIEASKKAHCHEFIKQLDDGYNTLVGERGIKLSGGQRQRIAIARAILKNAPILILDEATSALDSVTEKYVQESLHNLMKNCTTIIIAHRLSTLSEMDRILVFDKGHITQDDTHEELLKAKGHYAKMWNMQIGGFLLDNNL